MWTELKSFDGAETVCGRLARPDRYRHLWRALQEGPCIPRGAGLSYCAASAGEGVCSVSTRLFNRILHFDAKTGQVTVEPGVTVGDLFEFAVQRGLHPPVLPGHPQITVGGCVCFNVHGKNSHRQDHFISCIEELSVYHPDHGETECSRSRDAELFETTVGGFGLTGMVTRIALRLEPLAGQSVRRTFIPVDNLLHAVDVMEQFRDSSHCLYSWNDLNRVKGDFGKGIVYREDFRAEKLPLKGRFRPLDPDLRGRFGAPLLNRVTIPAINRAYLFLETLTKSRELDLRTAAFPLNGKEFYFHAFGRKGLREYQMLLPRSQWEQAVPELADLLRRHPVPASLGSLKLFDSRTRLLNFSGSGVCLTIDAPASAAALRLFSDLDELVARAGGIVNLCKDSRISGRLAEELFPEYALFRQRIEERDPHRRFDSALRRRLFG